MQNDRARASTHEAYAMINPANRPAQPRVRPCVREDLRIKERETDAAMGGVRLTPYIFTNVSSSACTLDGYPALELLNQRGTVIRRATKEKSDGPNTAATLKSVIQYGLTQGQSFSIDLGYIPLPANVVDAVSKALEQIS